MNTVGKTVSADRAHDRYMAYRQEGVQSLSDFANNFKLRVANMRASKCDYVPSEEAVARSFLKRLDVNRYGDYMINVINKAKLDDSLWQK